MSVSTDDAERIVAKAEFVETCLEILVERQSVPREEYAERVEVRDVVERRFEVMTQACIDVARILLVALETDVPRANADAMHRLASEGVISEGLAAAMAEACGLRNVLAHEYDVAIDDRIVYESLQDLERYRDFLAEVREFLVEDGAI